MISTNTTSHNAEAAIEQPLLSIKDLSMLYAPGKGFFGCFL